MKEPAEWSVELGRRPERNGVWKRMGLVEGRAERSLRRRVEKEKRKGKYSKVIYLLTYREKLPEKDKF